MIKLPTIDSSLEIGIGNLSTGEVKSSSNFVYFNCSSNIDCCSNMDIPVTENEIESIMKHDYHMDQIIDNPSPIIINKNKINPIKAYILKKNPFTGTCTFLQDNLCSIHEFKPFACKIYPFSIQFETKELYRLVLNENQICKSVIQTSKEKSNNLQHLKESLKLLTSRQ
jgi:Fe-S-cluster containining protein